MAPTATKKAAAKKAAAKVNDVEVEPVVAPEGLGNGKADPPAGGDEYPPVGSVWVIKDGRATWPVIVCSTPVEVGPGFPPDAGRVHVQAFFGLTVRANQNVPVAHLLPVGG